MQSFFEELKQRKVFRVAAAYCVVAWVLVQVADTVFPILELPAWTVRLVTILLILCFPVALILAWAFELTPDGIKRDQDASLERSGAQKRRPQAALLGLGIASAAAALFATHTLVRNGEEPAQDPVIVDPSVAVLPFVNMSADPEQDYFSHGIAEELLNHLARIDDLRVAGRTSSFAFSGSGENLREIGEALDVSHILEGSVRKAGNRVRISVKLINAPDGFELWSNAYDRQLEDVFAIQEEIARSVANALSVTLGVNSEVFGAGGTTDFEAFDAYLAGLALENRFGTDNILGAIGHFERAVDFDPDYAEAWGELAFTYGLAAILIGERSDEWETRARAALDRTRQIAPDSVAAFLGEAQLHERNREWRLAEAAFLNAIQRAPRNYNANIGYGSFLGTVGRSQEAIDYLRRASRAEPLFLAPVAILGDMHQYGGNLSEAAILYERGSELIGNRSSILISRMVTAMIEEDRATLTEILEQGTSRDDVSPDVLALRQRMLEMLDSPLDARTALHRFANDPDFLADNPFARQSLAIWASYHADDELALEIWRNLLQSSKFTPYAFWSPVHGDMRRLPRFTELIAELGLISYWQGGAAPSDYCRVADSGGVECQ